MQHKSSALKKEILNAVDELYEKNHRTPTITEISVSVNRSRSTVHAYLSEMSLEGMLRYESGDIETAFTRKVDRSTVLSPLIGSIACGQPQLEEENFEGYIALPKALFGEGPFFLLHASGESMIEAGIEPGDLVVVKKQNTAYDGDIIVALVDNETTLKRFYNDKEKQCVRLHPENKTMKDIIVKNCYIQGVAQHIIKKAR